MEESQVPFRLEKGLASSTATRAVVSARGAL
jgi:hypothetical protein